MAMVGHKTESVYRRYAIVEAATLREAAKRIDQASNANADSKGGDGGKLNPFCAIPP